MTDKPRDTDLRLIETAAEIQALPAEDAGTIGFTARLMSLAGLPHKDPGTTHYIRRNGNLQLIMIDPAGQTGLPYGAIPRLVLAWVTTEAVRTQSKRLVLGWSLNEFLRKLDITPGGGKRGSATRVRNQIERLFGSTLTVRYDDGQGQGYVVRHAPVAAEFSLWTGKDPNQAQLWENAIVLSDEFYKEIMDHPVPLDMRILKEIKTSPLAIDIYLWLTYRSSYLRKPTEISWAQLQQQFGAGYAANPRGRTNFQQAFKRELGRVLALYHGANIALEHGRVRLLPGEPSVSKQTEDSVEQLDRYC